MFLSLIFLLLALLVVIKSAEFATRYASKLAESFHLPKYVIGFLVVAVISILPETFISVTSALQGVPSLGLGTLFGSNVADLTIVFALVVFLSGRKLKVESKVIKNQYLYIVMLALPLIFGMNGYYSKIEGLTLVISGILFYLYILRHSRVEVGRQKERFSPTDMICLLGSMALLLFGSQFTVEYALVLSNSLALDPLIIGVFIIGLGTVLPELSFSVRAAKEHSDGLALGDILGTVIADATVVVGMMALISPFAFDPRIVYITGGFMIVALLFLLMFLRSGRVLTKKEALLLCVFYAVFLVTELFLGVGVSGS